MNGKLHFPEGCLSVSFLVVEEDQPSYPSDFQQRTLWRAITGVAILILGALLVGLVWLTSSVLGYLQPVLVPLAVAGIVAYLLDPVVLWLQKKGFSRIQGIATVFASFVLFVGAISWFVVSSASAPDDKKGDDDGGRGLVEKFSPEKVGDYKSGSLGWIGRWFYQKDPEVTLKHWRAVGRSLVPTITSGG